MSQGQPPQPHSVIELKVDELLERYKIEAHDVIVELIDFQPEEQSQLGPLLRTDHTIPCIPGSDPPQPSLLLHKLGELEHSKSESYAYIENHKYIGPTAFYGTSGAGKTRSLLEYLSHNKGLYFVPLETIPENEPGSQDLGLVFDDLRPLRGNETDIARTNDENLGIVRDRLMVVLYIRYAVHQHVVKLLNRDISAKEWLLMQLYPKHFLGGLDIFYEIAAKCFGVMDRDPIHMAGAAKVAFLSFVGSGIKWGAVVVDESQALMRNHKLYFVSDDNTAVQRSGFSALLKAFARIIYSHALAGHDKVMPYPTFFRNRIVCGRAQARNNVDLHETLWGNGQCSLYCISSTHTSECHQLHV